MQRLYNYVMLFLIVVKTTISNRFSIDESRKTFDQTRTLFIKRLKIW